MIIVVRLKDGIEYSHMNADRWRVERELPNILQIRQNGSLFLYNMDCVERCEVLCEEDDECES